MKKGIPSWRGDHLPRDVLVLTSLLLIKLYVLFMSSTWNGGWKEYVLGCYRDWLLDGGFPKQDFESLPCVSLEALVSFVKPMSYCKFDECFSLIPKILSSIII